MPNCTSHLHQVSSTHPLDLMCVYDHTVPTVVLQSNSLFTERDAYRSCGIHRQRLSGLYIFTRSPRSLPTPLYFHDSHCIQTRHIFSSNEQFCTLMLLDSSPGLYIRCSLVRYSHRTLPRMVTRPPNLAYTTQKKTAYDTGLSEGSVSCHNSPLHLAHFAQPTNCQQYRFRHQ